MRDFPALLDRFHAAWRPKRIECKGVEWEYFEGGGAHEAIVFLHGGMGTGESYFEYLLAMERSYRVLAPGLPATLFQLSDVVEGLAALLDAKHIAAAHLFGHSQGGCVAQAFARKFPSRTKTVTISNCALPSEAHARKVEKSLKLVGLAPEGLVRPMVCRRVAKILKTDAPEFSDYEREFWQRFMAGEMGNGGFKARALSSARIQLDYHRNTHFTERDLEGWPGRVLIFDSDGDTLITEAERVEQRALYPGAKVHTFQGAGHLDILTRCPDYIRVLTEFLGKSTLAA
jgi:pimeloyl-ACP methyl ester carboxylesterase